MFDMWKCDLHAGMLHSLGRAIKVTHESESIETNCTIILFLFASQQVNTGSIADKAGLQAGDAVVRINQTDLYNLRHKDAQDCIVKAGPSFELVIQRLVMTADNFSHDSSLFYLLFAVVVLHGSLQ